MPAVTGIIGIMGGEMRLSRFKLHFDIQVDVQVWD